MLFLSETFLSNYADDNNLYSIRKELNIIKEKLRKDFNVVTDWFFENYMSLNPTKCHSMCVGKNKENDTFIWMFSPRKSNNLINKVLQRSLRIVSGDNHSSFKSLLSKCIRK